jgi:hypothetical protein
MSQVTFKELFRQAAIAAGQEGITPEDLQKAAQVLVKCRATPIMSPIIIDFDDLPPDTEVIRLEDLTKNK